MKLTRWRRLWWALIYDHPVRWPIWRDMGGACCGGMVLAAVLLLLCLLLGACAPDEAFRVAFCGMPALVVGGLALAWALWR